MIAHERSLKPMELEQPSEQFDVPPDARPRLSEPPPVRIEAIDDVRLVAAAGLERELDRFYVDLLKFDREPENEEGVTRIIYRAENARVVLDVVETPPARDDYRALQVRILQFDDFVHALNEQEIAYEWQRGVSAGLDAVLLRDPAGNWLSVGWWKPLH